MPGYYEREWIEYCADLRGETIMLNEIETICSTYTGKALNFKILEFITKKLQEQSQDSRFADMTKDLKETYKNRLSRKTGWGSKELMVEFNEAFIEVLSKFVR